MYNFLKKKNQKTNKPKNLGECTRQWSSRKSMPLCLKMVTTFGSVIRIFTLHIKLFIVDRLSNLDLNLIFRQANVNICQLLYIMRYPYMYTFSNLPCVSMWSLSYISHYCVNDTWDNLVVCLNICMKGTCRRLCNMSAVISEFYGYVLTKSIRSCKFKKNKINTELKCL